MRRLSSEQPPSSLPPEVREWLSRLVISINSCIDQISDMDGIDKIPSDPKEGMVRYFKVAVPPQITSKGFWGYEGAWVKLS